MILGLSLKKIAKGKNIKGITKFILDLSSLSSTNIFKNLYLFFTFLLSLILNNIKLLRV
jgi:hypothetical protein